MTTRLAGRHFIFGTFINVYLARLQISFYLTTRTLTTWNFYSDLKYSFY